MTRATDIDAAAVITTIRQQFATIVDHDETLPSVTVQNVWIHGSYGADDATATSDVDITIEVGVSESVTDPDRAFTLIDTLADTGGRITDALTPQLPGYPDVAVIPEASLLETADLPAPTAREHVREKTRNGEYRTVYDVLARDYVPVTDV